MTAPLWEVLQNALFLNSVEKVCVSLSFLLLNFDDLSCMRHLAHPAEMKAQPLDHMPLDISG